MAQSRSDRLNEIYSEIRDKKLSTVSPAVKGFSDNGDALSYDDIPYEIDELGKKIEELREEDFDYKTEENNKKILIKYHPENHKTDQLDPIHKNEANVQTLRYLRGMLLIAKNSENFISDDSNEYLHLKLREEIGRILNDEEKNKLSPIKQTEWIAEQFSKCLKNIFDISIDSARRQVTMARDLGILLENHPNVCTISENTENKTVTIEKSIPYKISDTYYKIFNNINNQDWFKNAKIFGGFHAKAKTTWLEKFFENNLDVIKKLGVSAPPSARWLPIPANHQIVETDIAPLDLGNNKKRDFSHTSFIRSGVIVPYDIRKTDKDKEVVQMEIAKEILKEIITQQLKEKIKEYKDLYKDLVDQKFDFYINYQTLLSPLIGEKLVGFIKDHVDNNTKFIALAKKVINSLPDDDQFMKDIKKNIGDENINLKFHHTNSAVNRNAKISTRDIGDDEIRKNKIKEFNIIRDRIRDKFFPDYVGEFRIQNQGVMHRILQDGYGKQFIEELILRERACDNLGNLLNNQDLYKKLDLYQRNIMIAALEHLTMGSQSLTMVGCKSARDRTGIFACAVRTMQTNPDAMREWGILEKGIVESLKQGHAFRSMIFHSAIVKVSLVHKNFMEGLEKKTQDSIKDLLVFSKKLDKYNKPKKKEKEITDTHLLPALVASKLEPLIELQEEHTSKKRSFKKNHLFTSSLFNHDNETPKETDLAKIQKEAAGHKKMINKLAAKDPFKKQDALTWSEHINSCEKLLDKVKKIEGDRPGEVECIVNTLNELIATRCPLAKYEEETKNENIKIMKSTYVRNGNDIDLSHTIEKTNEGGFVSTFQHPERLSLLGKEKGSQGSKLFTLNALIMWIEDICAASSNKTLTLNNYDSLDKKALHRLIVYCELKQYDLHIPGLPNTLRPSENEKNNIKKLFEKYKPALYKIEDVQKQKEYTPPPRPTLTAG